MPTSKSSWLYRLRQNHAVEHATIHVLSQRFLNIRLIGRSDFWGFSLVGNVSTQDLASASIEALSRLQRGESSLAVHPRCGTNLATSALLAGAFSSVAVGGKTRSRWEKLPRAILATMGALLIAQPLGLWIQGNLTTTPDVANVQIDSVIRRPRGQMVSHRVKTRYG